MVDEDGDEDEPATRVGRVPPSAPPGAPDRPPADGPTRQFAPPRLESTRAMPAGYGASLFMPPARPSAPRPAAGRPAVPQAAVDDPESFADMTLIERIDAELESVTSELSIPEGMDPSMLDEPSAGSEATIRFAVPDDLPRDLLERGSEPGTMLVPPRAVPPPASSSPMAPRRPAPAPPPSLSSMPTPALPAALQPALGPPPAPALTPPAAPAVATPGVGLATGPSPRTSAPPPADRAAAAAAPAPPWVVPYVVLCLIVSLLGAAALGWLRLARYW